MYPKMLFETSSDERKSGEDDGEPKKDDYDWISQILNETAFENHDFGVVLANEVILEIDLKSSNVDDDDDDCVILEEDPDCVILGEDPDKPMAVVNNAVGLLDELLVVGEKGQVACRDYPHPRHLCAKFSFATTSHETHCTQCHCYVCDTLAPCVHWGTGSSYLDHCHATDKSDSWKRRRKMAKLYKNGSPSVTGSPHTSLPINQVPVRTLCNNSLPRYPVSRPTAIRPCSSSTNFVVPDIISQSKIPPAWLAPNIRLPSFTVAPKLHEVRNNSIIRKDRPLNSCSLGHRSVSSPSLFKREAYIPVNQPYTSPYKVNDAASQYSRNMTLLPLPILNPWQHSPASVNSQPNLSGILENSPPSQPAVSQNIRQQGNQTLYPVNSSFNTSISNQQSQGQKMQPQSVVPTRKPPVVPTGSGKNINQLYFQLENWLSEAADQNILYPESAHIDPGSLCSILKPL